MNNTLLSVSINQKSESYRKVHNLINNLISIFEKEGIQFIDTSFIYNLQGDLNSGKLSENLQDANPKFFSACLNNITAKLQEIYNNNGMIIGYTSKTARQILNLLDSEMNKEHYSKFVKGRKSELDRLDMYLKPQDYFKGTHFMHMLYKGIGNENRNYFSDFLNYVKITINYEKDTISLVSNIDVEGVRQSFRKIYFNIMENQLNFAKQNLIYKFSATSINEKQLISNNGITNTKYILITPKKLSTASRVESSLKSGNMSNLSQGELRDLQERYARLKELVKDLNNTPSKKNKLKKLKVTNLGVEINSSILVDFQGILNRKINKYITTVGNNSYELFLKTLISKKIFGNDVDELELKIAFKILLTAYDRKRTLVV